MKKLYHRAILDNMKTDNSYASSKIGNRSIWVTWENQRRNEFIANEISVPLYVFDFKGNRIIRYIKCIYKTFSAYRKINPIIIFCQNPSVVLAILSLLYVRMCGAKLCIDTHNYGLALEGQHWLTKKIAVFLQRHADLIIVTNETLKRIVESNGGTAVVLPDNLPVIDITEEYYPFDHSHNLLFICTYATDEPYEEVIEAAKILDRQNIDVGIYVTGRIPGNLKGRVFSKNLHLLGFVSWEDFDLLLQSCDGIIDLTTRENCLVCGAYEAVSVGTPGILSDKEALKEYFNKGFCYTDNTSGNLAEAVLRLLHDKESLIDQVAQLKKELKTNWKVSKKQLSCFIDSMIGSPP
jgi:glycosyltransferase involved in cell wall biosynthesis